MSAHPEDICEDCNGRNVVWFAPSELWNKVVRKPDIADPMLCPRCFILRAENIGIQYTWEVKPEFGDGRSWQKIETAPKDVVIIQGWSGGLWFPSIRFNENAWERWNGSAWIVMVHQPTHWLQIPAAPEKI